MAVLIKAMNAQGAEYKLFYTKDGRYKLRKTTNGQRLDIVLTKAMPEAKQ